jgi:hypothetical protein
MSNTYWVSETFVWKITAESEEEAKQTWEAYLDDAPDMSKMVLKGIEHDTDWGES